MVKRTLLALAPMGMIVGGIVPGCGSDDATTTTTEVGCIPSVEVCDGKDNDCDGLVDEDLTEVCVENGQVGERTCQNGQWGACQTECTPTAEICDGKDNDCDGAVDEDEQGNALTQVCTDSNGVPGIQICHLGAWGECQSDCIPSEEVCDGKDNDCDGLVDEDDAGNPLKRDCSNSCGLGAEICVNGTWQSCTAPQPSVEVCDGVDNDCNGEIDDGFACAKGEQANCGTNVGECEYGTKVCGPTCEWGACLGGVTPVEEVCEGSKDENCDGTVDEGCACTNGEVRNCCGGTTITCTNGIWPSCPPTPTEVCNGIDDDCNDLIDDGLPVNPYQLDESISGIDDCNHAYTLGAIMEGTPAQSFSHYLYKPDLSEDRDFFLFRADENSDLIGCAISGPYECYTLVVKMTNVPTGSDYDFCVYDVGFENSTATCAAPEQKICASAKAPFNQVTVNWAGDCIWDDTRYFFLEVFSKAGTPQSCKPYTFTIEHLDNTPQETACVF